MGPGGGGWGALGPRICLHCLSVARAGPQRQVRGERRREDSDGGKEEYWAGDAVPPATRCPGVLCPGQTVSCKGKGTPQPSFCHRGKAAGSPEEQRDTCTLKVPLGVTRSQPPLLLGDFCPHSYSYTLLVSVIPPPPALYTCCLFVCLLIDQQVVIKHPRRRQLSGEQGRPSLGLPEQGRDIDDEE